MMEEKMAKAEPIPCYPCGNIHCDERTWEADDLFWYDSNWLCDLCIDEMLCAYENDTGDDSTDTDKLVSLNFYQNMIRGFDIKSEAHLEALQKELNDAHYELAAEEPENGGRYSTRRRVKIIEVYLGALGYDPEGLLYPEVEAEG